MDMSFSIQPTCPIVPDTSDKLFFFFLLTTKECVREKDWSRVLGWGQNNAFDIQATGNVGFLFALHRELPLNTLGFSGALSLDTTTSHLLVCVLLLSSREILWLALQITKLQPEAVDWRWILTKKKKKFWRRQKNCVKYVLKADLE